MFECFCYNKEDLICKRKQSVQIGPGPVRAYLVVWTHRPLFLPSVINIVNHCCFCLKLTDYKAYNNLYSNSSKQVETPILIHSTILQLLISFFDLMTVNTDISSLYKTLVETLGANL